MESNAKAEPAQSDNKIYVRGGIKDVCQSLWYFQNNPGKEYLVHTHNPDIKQFFDFYSCKNVHYYFYEDEESHDKTVEEMIRDHATENQENITDVLKSFYCAYNFGFLQEELSTSLIESFKEKKPIVGIHPFVSKFSSKMYKSFGIPDITIPHDVLQEIISDDFNYLIFGREDELSKIDIKKQNVKMACYDDLLTTINLVKYCDKFIGTFSSFKTIAASQNISTFCIMPLQPISRGMEATFVDQYVKDGVMKVYKVENYDLEKDNFMLELNEFLKT